MDKSFYEMVLSDNRTVIEKWEFYGFLDRVDEKYKEKLAILYDDTAKILTTSDEYVFNEEENFIDFFGIGALAIVGRVFERLKDRDLKAEKIIKYLNNTDKRIKKLFVENENCPENVDYEAELCCMYTEIVVGLIIQEDIKDE